MFPRLLIAACCGLFSGVALAQDHQHDYMSEHAGHGQWQAPQVKQPWSRAMPPTAPTGAVYFVLHNPAGMADRLIGASTPRAEKAELHQHVHENGLMRMRQVDAVSLEPRGRVIFEPGGYHVMLFGLKQPLVAGDRFPITLHLETAGDVTTEVQVLEQAPAAASHDGHPQH